MFISASFRNPHYFNTIFLHAQASNFVCTPVFFHYILMLVYLYLRAIFKSWMTSYSFFLLQLKCWIFMKFLKRFKRIIKNNRNLGAWENLELRLRAPAPAPSPWRKYDIQKIDKICKKNMMTFFAEDEGWGDDMRATRLHATINHHSRSNLWRGGRGFTKFEMENFRGKSQNLGSGGFWWKITSSDTQKSKTN